MRAFAKTLGLGLVAVALYAAWPCYAAFEIRHAMLAGDTALLVRKVDWEGVRASLKASLRPEDVAHLSADPTAPHPSLWQRVRSALGRRVADSVIDRYATAENLPTLLGYGRLWRQTLQSALQGRSGAPSTALSGTRFEGTFLDRFVSGYRRVKRAAFASPTRFELEVSDRYRPTRRYAAALELKGWDWKLTELQVLRTGS
jgi:hypothetical protein